jgi:hypothetical protein
MHETGKVPPVCANTMMSICASPLKSERYPRELSKYFVNSAALAKKPLKLLCQVWVAAPFLNEYMVKTLVSSLFGTSSAVPPVYPISLDR